MGARELLSRMCEVIDAHQWAALPPLLAADFSCRYVHSGETFDRTAWLMLNTDTPDSTA
jgi:hypothetical protein